MWCIPAVTPEFIARMEEVLSLYAKPYDRQEPALCFDEKSKQLLEETRPHRKTKAGKVRRRDYEYKRNGTENIFVTVEPRGGFRTVRVTRRRTKRDFAREIRRIALLTRYAEVRKLHIVLDNLNTHGEHSLLATFGTEETRKLMRRIKFHHTPKHASWLNMAEIEIGVLSKQCIRGHIPTVEKLRSEIAAWQRRRNRERATINWTMTTQDARKKFKYSGSKLS